MNLLSLLRNRFEPALHSMVSDVGPCLDMIRPAQDAKFGDFQANFAMSLSKQLGKPPRDIALAVIEKLNVSDICETPEVVGPGFINLRLREQFLSQAISSIAGDDRLGVQPTESPRHVVVDFSSPNVAKPMHVGHLRSTVIGDAICRTLRFAGHQVTSDNHIGDWGTQFGMIIFGYRHFRNDAAFQAEPVAELARLYKLVNTLSDYQAKVPNLTVLEQSVANAASALAQQEALAKTDEKAKKTLNGLRKQLSAVEEDLKNAQELIEKVQQSPTMLQASQSHPDMARKAREETAKLHAGDTENNRLWNEFLPACLAALNHIYDRLGIQFDLTLGESYFNPMLAGVVDGLKSKGLARLSEGAICVFIEGIPAPFMVQKSDGAYTYATTDLATIQYRLETLRADEVLYVVDKRQSKHFQQLFSTTELWAPGKLTLQHVSFGTVMGKDGKPYKTRSGDTVGLESLLDEAITRARKIVDENDDRRKSPMLTAAERAHVAEIVGIGGIKYADLHHDRDSDYVFDWDKMLATTGDTATYMQYAYARICGIFRKLNLNRDEVARSGGRILLTCPEERRLALQLLMFGYAIDSVLKEYRPHLLTTWLFDTADAFSRFYDRCSVQDAESEALRTSRLILCDLMSRALKTGLSLLGIEVAEVM
ncbi:MAG: arginine--tRNA ligase [Planctomycetota bacterium]